MSVTYFVALPFVRTEEGDLVAGQAEEFQTAGGATGAAARLARSNAGAVAFSRTGDPGVGEFSDAVIIRTYGETLTADELLVG